MVYLNYVCWVRMFLYGALHDFYRKLNRIMQLVNQSHCHFRSSNKAHNFNFCSSCNRFKHWFFVRLRVMIMLWWTNHAKEAEWKLSRMVHGWAKRQEAWGKNCPMFLLWSSWKIGWRGRKPRGRIDPTFWPGRICLKDQKNQNRSAQTILSFQMLKEKELL